MSAVQLPRLLASEAGTTVRDLNQIYAKIETLMQLLRAQGLGVRASGAYLRRFILEEEGRLFFVKAEDVDWIQAQGNYIRLHSRSHSHRLRQTMDNVESMLDPHQFLRVHRSVIVNLERVLEFQLPARGNRFVVLQNGKRLPLGKSYRGDLRRTLQQQQFPHSLIRREAGQRRDVFPPEL